MEIKHQLKQVHSYIGDYHNYETGAKYKTVLADWECGKCNLVIRGYPDGLGEPKPEPNCRRTKCKGESHGT